MNQLQVLLHTALIDSGHIEKCGLLLRDSSQIKTTSVGYKVREQHERCFRGRENGTVFVFAHVARAVRCGYAGQRIQSADAPEKERHLFQRGLLFVHTSGW